jgi:hypothetical protein
VPLDAATANVEVLKWLRDVANVRLHKGTGERPTDRLGAEQARLLPYEPSLVSLDTPAGQRLHTPLPVESLQHPLSVYSELLGDAGKRTPFGVVLPGRTSSFHVV